ncbi:MAG: nucleotidyltransferase domain-containing protein [Candidatus Pacearchaeota archaeon]
MNAEEKKQEKNNLDNIKDHSEIYKKISNQIPEKGKKELELENVKKEIEKLKKEVIKKYSFVLAIGIIPPQANEKFVEEEIEEELPKEEIEQRKKLIHLAIIIPDEKIKELPKIKLDLIQKVKEYKQKVWLHFFSPNIIWEMCMDEKYDLVEALSMSFPLFDKGILGSLRLASIHKTLVLRKFEKYVVSYVIAGSLVRGEAKETSDVDVYVIINDTDVKRMNRFELKEKLRSIIYSYIIEASEIAGVKNKLNVQVYILTEFWESVKDANPVIFTFIRDGVPLFDQGTFMPWKLLLKMGKLKPSPEAIDMFMSIGDKIEEIAKKKLIDIVINEMYWGIVTPSQALLMLYGIPPLAPKETVSEMKKIFLDKEKILEKKYIDILEKIIKLYKAYEHDELKEIKGKEIDVLIEECREYMKRLKELRKQIEERVNEKTIEELYKNVIELMKNLFGRGSEKIYKEKIEEKIKNGIFPSYIIKLFNNLLKIKKEIKKASKHEVENARKDANILINYLTEYNQRQEFLKSEKNRYKIKIKDKIKELVILGKEVFLLDEKKVYRYNEEKEVFKESNIEEISNFISNKEEEIKLNDKFFSALKKQFGNYEITF